MIVHFSLQGGETALIIAYDRGVLECAKNFASG